MQSEKKKNVSEPGNGYEVKDLYSTVISLFPYSFSTGVHSNNPTLAVVCTACNWGIIYHLKMYAKVTFLTCVTALSLIL